MSALTPPTGPSRPLADLDLDADTSAPGRARDCVREMLPALDDTTLDDILLAVSELVTNAVKHGAAPVRLTIEAEEGLVRLQVHDAGDADAVPAPSRPTVTAGSGRGLMLVAAVSSSWGVTPAPTQPGKSVWAAFPVPTPVTATVVRLAGDLDLAAARRTGVQLRRVHLAPDVEVRLDLSEVRFIDSAVLHLFADLQARAASDGGRVRIVGASSSVRRVIVMTGLGDLLE